MARHRWLSNILYIVLSFQVQQDAEIRREKNEIDINEICK